MQNLSFNPNNGLILNTKTGHIYTSSFNNYVRLKVNGKNYMAHRLMWEKFHGPIPEGYQIDHISGIRNDNRLENLRLATATENAQNRQTSNSNNKVSSVPGVSYCQRHKKYRVTLYLGYQQKFYGYYSELCDAEEQAIIARKALFAFNTL